MSFKFLTHKSHSDSTYDGKRIPKELVFVLLSVLTLALAGFFYSLAFQQNRTLSPFFVAAIRVLFAFIPILYLMSTKQISLDTLRQWKDTSLILWGLFGALTIATYFLSIPLAGVGFTQFLGSIQGLVILFGLWPILSQVHRKNRLISVLISLLGLLLLVSTKKSTNFVSGWTWLPGICSGVFAGLAYTHLGAASKRHQPAVVSLYWGIPSLLTIILLTAFYSENILTWIDYSPKLFIFTTLGGGMTALSQFFFTKAARHIDLVFATLLTYLASVANLIFDVAVGSTSLSKAQTLGITFIFFGSAIWPYWKRNNRAHHSSLLPP